jgi:ketosteroid isomerase-like protein
MAPSSDEVRALFANLSARENQANFWSKVAENVDWWIVGQTPMSGKYSSKKAFLDATIEVLNGKVLDGPLLMRTVNVVGGGKESEWATVEMEAIDAKCRNGMVYDMRYCWNVRFGKDGIIEQVRAFIDTDLLERAIKENQ